MTPGLNMGQDLENRSAHPPAHPYQEFPVVPPSPGVPSIFWTTGARAHFPLSSFYWFLVTLSLDYLLVLLGEKWYWSFLALKGFTWKESPVLVSIIGWFSNRTGTSFWQRERARKGLNATSGVQFAGLPLVKPVVWLARAVVNWRPRSVNKSA